MKKFLLSLLSLISFEQIGMAQTHEEKILGYQASDKGLIFHVTSGGCTRPEDFRVQINPDKTSGVTDLTLIRIRQDGCVSFIPTGVRIQLSYAEIGINASDDFEIKNPNGIVKGWVWKDAPLLSTSDQPQ